MHGAHGWRKTGRNKGNTMDTRWLQDFVTLSEVRNFTRAAELRNLSQAAFSRRIQSLEQWLGARLIDRNAYPTQLTDAGERFRAIAIELINQLAEARADIGGAPGRNQIRLAAPCAGHHAAAGLVAAMGRRTGLQLHAADRQCARYGVGLHGGRHRPGREPAVAAHAGRGASATA